MRPPSFASLHHQHVMAVTASSQKQLCHVDINVTGSETVSLSTAKGEAKQRTHGKHARTTTDELLQSLNSRCEREVGRHNICLWCHPEAE